MGAADLDRTTDGTGLVAKTTLAEIRKLDAGAKFNRRFAGEQVPTLSEALEHAAGIGIGLVVEIKEFQALDQLIDRLGEVVVKTGAAGGVIFISFDHLVLKKLKARLPGQRTEGIVHARHADIVTVARAADLNSVAIEHMMFQPEDARALHAAGVAVRFHLMRPEEYARYRDHGVNLLTDVPGWLAEGAIDTISGDDVAFLAELAAGASAAGARAHATA